MYLSELNVTLHYVKLRLLNDCFKRVIVKIFN